MKKILKAYKTKKKKRSDHWIIYFRDKKPLELFGLDIKSGELYSVNVSYTKKPGHLTAKINPNDRFFWSDNREQALKIAVEFLKSLNDEAAS